MTKVFHTNRSDDELLKMIRAGGRSRLTAINHIYANQTIKSKIKNHVLKMGGDHQESEDVFHEGIIALDRNIRTSDFKQETSIEGYLFSICRNTWNNIWRKKSKTSSNELMDHQNISEDQTDELLFSQERRKYLQQVLELLDDQCRKILTLWKASYAMQEIADNCGLANKAMAKKYRYRCMKKLMNKLSQQSELLEALRHV